MYSQTLRFVKRQICILKKQKAIRFLTDSFLSCYVYTAFYCSNTSCNEITAKAKAAFVGTVSAKAFNIRKS